MEDVIRTEALEQIGEALARLPETEIRSATTHLIGIINGMAMARALANDKTAS